ncbi:hypothetical protein M419DRAFT_119876 [Trichoderma reesei RUT C-30]|jgi:hypothetical protein|uniref:Uncharacterized protein n=1 Tax=Hypocrea jecorina (strain ATCC 56765 / BCRC 32924 / NRRL 11460 / Rut C-30) TaxID=1344414 RepID=A0A024S3E9_HYPJR|nr:hypothetical protein M419DRAFT_119876 [Trichoderma reesei RUT C-30]
MTLEVSIWFLTVATYKFFAVKGGRAPVLVYVVLSSSFSSRSRQCPTASAHDFSARSANTGVHRP